MSQPVVNSLWKLIVWVSQPPQHFFPHFPFPIKCVWRTGILALRLWLINFIAARVALIRSFTGAFIFFWTKDLNSSPTPFHVIISLRKKVTIHWTKRWSSPESPLNKEDHQWHVLFFFCIFIWAVTRWGVSWADARMTQAAATGHMSAQQRREGKKKTRCHSESVSAPTAACATASSCFWPPELPLSVWLWVSHPSSFPSLLCHSRAFRRVYLGSLHVVGVIASCFIYKEREKPAKENCGNRDGAHRRLQITV